MTNRDDSYFAGCLSRLARRVRRDPRLAPAAAVRDRNGVCVRRYRWAQGRKICVLDASARKRPVGVKHTLNLLRGLQERGCLSAARKAQRRSTCVLVKRIR
jgi:hypothetical protein